MNTTTTQFIFDNGEFFAAHTSNGGVRVGVNNFAAFEVPPGHALYAQMVMLDNADAIESFIDSQIESGSISFFA